MKRNKWLLSLSIGLLCCGSAYAQTTVKGKITSEGGEPLIGATVAVKNSTDGTVTDIDGNYSLKTKKTLTQKDLLVFSYVGYKTLQKNYAGNTMNVKLAEESQQLNDVVVTALGIKREEKGLGYDIPVYQPQRARDEEFIEELKNLNPDVIVVVAYGQILPESILNIPKYGCINVHGSLLPKYRGAAPIQWAVLDGEEKTGITTMYMEKGLDTGDLAGLLTNLEENDVLFIDEIHRLSPIVEEILYPALEDYQIDIMIGEGPAARSIKLDLPPFTLIGATTRAGSLTNPLRARFGIVNQLQFYTTEELITIVRRSARLLGVSIDPEGAAEIASRSRGTPRVANRLLRRVRDYAEVRHDGTITREVASAALTMLDVDPVGLDFIDRRFLLTILEKFSGGPVGIDNLAAAIGEDRDTLEDVVEPYLIQQGFLQRTPRGRMAAHRAWEHFKLTPPANQGGAVMRDATLF